MSGLRTTLNPMFVKRRASSPLSSESVKKPQLGLTKLGLTSNELAELNGRIEHITKFGRTELNPVVRDSE